MSNVEKIYFKARHVVLSRLKMKQPRRLKNTVRIARNNSKISKPRLLSIPKRFCWRKTIETILAYVLFLFHSHIHIAYGQPWGCCIENRCWDQIALGRNDPSIDIAEGASHPWCSQFDLRYQARNAQELPSRINACVVFCSCGQATSESTTINHWCVCIMVCHQLHRIYIFFRSNGY